MLTNVRKTHDAVSIVAGASITHPFVSVDGFDKLIAHVSALSSVNITVSIDWSFDGVNVFSKSPTTVYTTENGNTAYDVIAPYARLLVKNTDSSTRVTNAYIYLKQPF